MEKLQTLNEKHVPDIEDLRNRAWTFRGSTPPNNAKKVAEEMRRGMLYEYYIDSDGNVWFEREISKEYDKKIAAWAKEQAKKRSARPTT